MKSLFTIQSKEVLQILLNAGEYYPDINKSVGYEDMKKLYPYLLDIFNELNNSNYTGFVFSFLSDNKTGKVFNTIDDLYEYFLNYPNIIDMFNFWNDEYTILELEIDESINLMPVDINDSIKLDAVITQDCQTLSMCGYKNQEDLVLDIYNIENHLIDGTINPNTRLKSFIQGHYPHIKLSNIKNIYYNYNLNESKQSNTIKLFDLPNEAKSLELLL